MPKSQNILKFVLLILPIVLFASLISCNAPDASNAQNDPAQKETAAQITTSIEELYPYPEYDFGGGTIKILARRDGANGQQDFEDICVEEMNGEVLNDAVYTRTLRVEEKYNVKFDITYNADPSALTAKNVKANDDAYQILQEKLIFLQQTLGTQNYLYDFNKIDGVTLEAPWYNRNLIKDLAINKKVTALGGDMEISDKSGLDVTVFNKKMAADYGLEDLYQTVRDGKWTLDKLQELMRATSRDLNGDGKMTLGDDQWGFMAEDFTGWIFSVSSGNRLAALDDNGIPYITANTPKAVSDWDKILDIMHDKENRILALTIEEYVETFMNNRNFLQANALCIILMMRAMEQDFGIIPMPKYDEAQKDYITPMSPYVSRFIAVPVTCANTETVGAVIDALAREGTNTVMPAYYDNLINNKIARDEESIEMLKMIFDTVVYDIGSIYNWGNLWFIHQQFVKDGTKDYVSVFEKNAPAIQKAMEKTIEMMQNSD
ncbi:MAG: hypothetical protein FWD23_02370 [Oscillospiraceae bacterium]|nr:hypothetical protein [Oscillospiraceae bacterium]